MPCEGQPAQKGCSFLHRFWSSPVSPGRSPSQPHDTCIQQDNLPVSTLSVWAEKKYPAAISALEILLVSGSSGWQLMAISVTALVLSGFHPHQPIVLYICSAPFLPPELAGERKWTAECVCRLDWDSKHPDFPSTHTCLVTSEQQRCSNTSNITAGFLEATEMTGALNTFLDSLLGNCGLHLFVTYS